MNWIDEIFSADGLKKKASDETNQQKEFDKKVANQEWMKDIMNIDEAALAKEEESAFVAEELARGLEIEPEAAVEPELKKEAAYEKGDTRADTIEKDYELRVKGLSDYNLAEMLAEYSCLENNTATLNLNEEKESQLKSVTSGRDAAEKKLLKYLGDHTILDWKKSFKELENSEVKQAAEKDLYSEWKTGKMAWDEKTKFEATTEKEKVEQMDGVGKEEEKAQVGKEAAKTEFVKCPTCDSKAARKHEDGKITCVTCGRGEEDKKASKKTAATPSEMVEKKVEKLIKDKIEQAFAEAPAETPADFPTDPLMVGEGTPEDKILDEIKAPHLEPGETPETEIQEWNGEKKEDKKPEDKKEDDKEAALKTATEHDKLVDPEFLKDVKQNDPLKDKQFGYPHKKEAADPLVEAPASPATATTPPNVPQDEHGTHGWKNYDTYIISIWLDQDEELSRQVQELAGRVKDKAELENGIRALVEERVPDLGMSMFSDILGNALREADWEHIADYYSEDMAPASVPAPEEATPAAPEAESMIPQQASKAEVLKKIAEIPSPWKVEKNEKGEEVIARIDPIKTKKVSKDKEKNDITNDVK